MNRLKIGILYVLLCTIVIGFTGCQSRGTYANPLQPMIDIQETSKDTATVYLYRSSDHFGILKFQDYYVYIDEDKEGFSIDNKDQVMVANRTNYYVSEVKPGIHSFTIGGFLDIGRQIVELKKGSEYYLSITFAVGGTPGLEFKTKQDFLEETKAENQVRIVGKWSSFDGYKTEVVKH